MLGRNNSIEFASGHGPPGQRIRKSQGPKDEASWEEKYLQLREDHAALKHQSNEQQTVMKQMYTKLQLIDKTMSAKEQANEKGLLNTSRGPVRTTDTREADELIQILRKENDRLRMVNRNLREQLRTAPKTAPGSVRRKVAPATAGPPSSRGGGAKLGMSASESAALSTLRQKLLAMENRITKLHEENNMLRRRTHQQPSAPAEPDLENVLGNMNRGGQSGMMGGKPRESGVFVREQETLARDLKDKEAQLRIVKSRYEHLEAKARAAAEIHERTVHRMEEGNRTIRDLRRKLQTLHHDNEQLGVHQQHAQDLSVELAAAKEEIQTLEHRITALCESPFINDAFESRSKVDKLLGLERADRQQKVQIEHLKETAKMHHAEILALKSSSEQLCNQRDQLAKENHALKLKLEQLERGSSVLEDKMRLYSGEAGVDSSELERALTMIKRSKESMGQVDFLETAPTSDRKLQDLQVAHLNTCRELEMTERMLKAQTSINRDLNDEITDLQRKLKGSNNELLRKLDDYENLCARRLQKIHALEAQVKQLLKKAKKQQTARDAPGSPRSVDPGDDAISIASLAASASDFGPGENLIEIWIQQANLDEHKLEYGATTFVMLDFYDYETQTSPLVTGLHPNFNFAATYRVTVDHFLLRYLASETLTLELNRTRHGDFELLGQTSLSMRPLLQGDGKWQVEDAQIISVRDGSVIGTFKICIRLALPIETLFETYLREVPGERERIERLKTVEEEHEEVAIARAKAQNQLEITVIACEGLPTKDRALPSPFVHFQLLSFPDTFTPILQSTSDPVYDFRAPFPLLVDDKILRYLEREKLEINVLDDDDDDGNAFEGDGFDGLLGKTVVPLAKLAQGKAISGKFPLRDADGRDAGSLQVRIAWRSPLVTVEQAGTSDIMSLSEEHVQTLVKRFDHGGAVDWRRFLRLADDGVQAIRVRLNRILEKAEDSGVDLRVAMQNLDSNSDGFIAPADIRSVLEEFDFSLREEDFDRFLLIVDENRQGRISYEDFLRAMETPTAAEQKTVKALRTLIARETDLENPFKRRQVEGLLSKRDFCRALHELGFRLQEHELLGGDPREEPDFLEHNGHGDDTGVDEPTRVGPDETHRAKEGSRKKRYEEQEITSPTQPAHIQEYERKKLEFQERLARASQATDAVYGYSLAEHESLQSLYGNNADFQATKLQSTYRSYRTRALMKEKEPEKLLENVALVDAEDLLRQGLSQKQSGFDIRLAFSNRDKNRSGYVSIPHFVRGIMECDLGLMTSHAMALAKHFIVDPDAATTSRDAASSPDIQQQRAQVDYNEFVRFARFQARNVSGLTFQVCNALLQVQSEHIFNEADLSRQGVVSRRDFAKTLRLHIAALNSYDIKTLTDIFDTNSNGEVDYRAFVRFAQGQPIAIALRSLENRLRDLLRRLVASGINIADAFQHFDKNNDGEISRSEFSQTLRSLRIDINHKEASALFARFDPKRKGRVLYKDFVKFMQEPDSDKATNPPNLSVDQQTLLGARKRLQNIVRNALTAGVTLHGPFEHYDWTRTGKIPPGMFERSCTMLGLPLTYEEIHAIQNIFIVGSDIDYRSFVDWCTVKRAAARDVVEKLRQLGQHSRITTVFQHFDPAKKGEVSRKDFQAALGQLGMEQLDGEELIALFEQFDRDGDGFIQYLEFAKVLQEGASSTHANSPDISLSPRDSGRSASSGKEILLREELRTLRNALESRDVNFNGRLSQDAFQSALGQVGIEYNGKIESILDSDGFVVYRKYLQEQEGNQEYVDAVFRKLCRLIMNRAAAAEGDMTVPFEHFKEHADSGSLTFNGFEQGLAALQFDLGPAEIHALIERFDQNTDGRISYEEFVHAVEQQTSSMGPGDPQSPSSTPRPAKRQLTDHQVMLMKRLVYSGRRRGVNFRALFAHHGAKPQDTTLRKDPFLAALHKVDPTIPIDNFEDLATALDIESTGAIEFARVMHVAEAENTYTLAVAALGEQVRAMVAEQVGLQGNIRVPFTHFDRRRKGHFDLAAWQRAVQDLALEATDQDIIALFQYINVSGNGKVSFGEFASFMQDPEFAPQLERMVRKLIMSSVLTGEWSKEPKKEIRKFDEDGTGSIDRHGLRSACKKMGLPLGRDDVSRIVVRYDPDGAGSAKLSDVIDWFEHCVKLARQAVTIADRLRKGLQARSLMLQQLLSPGVGGVCSKSLFINQLIEAQLGIDERDAHLLADCFTFAGTASNVDVQECIDFISGGLANAVAESHSARDSGSLLPERTQVSEQGAGDESIDALIVKLQHLLHQAHLRGVDYRTSFEHFDKDYSGQISYEDFKTGLEELDFRLNKRQLTEMFKRFAGSKHRTIKYRRFLRECVPADVAYVETVAEKLREQIQKRVLHYGRGGLQKTFRHFEPDAKGYVSREAFRSGLEALRFELSDSEVRALLDKFDIDGDGRISFDEFISFAQGEDASVLPSSARREIDRQADKIAEELRSLVRKAHKKGVAYRQAFEHFDPHYAGFIDADDFRRGLQQLNFDVQPEHVRLLIERFAGKDMRVRYRDFLRAIAPEDEATAEEVADKFRRMLGRVASLRKAFRHFDQDENGLISGRAFQKGLERLKFDLGDSEIRLIIDMFDQDGDGFISYDEFVDFATGDGSKQSEAGGSRKSRSGSKDSKASSKRGKDAASEHQESQPSSEASIKLHVQTIKLGKLQTDLERVFLQFRFPGEEIVRTSAASCSGTHKRQTVKCDQVKYVEMLPGSRARKLMKSAVKSGKAYLEVELLGVKPSGRTKTLGQTRIDFVDLLEEMRDIEKEDLEIFDREDRVIAKINLSVKALDLLQLLQKR